MLKIRSTKKYVLDKDERNMLLAILSNEYKNMDAAVANFEQICHTDNFEFLTAHRDMAGHLFNKFKK